MKEFDEWWRKRNNNKFAYSKPAYRLALEAFCAGVKTACDKQLEIIKGENK